MLSKIPHELMSTLTALSARSIVTVGRSDSPPPEAIGSKVAVPLIGLTL